GERNRGGHSRPGAHHDQEVVLPQREDGLPQLRELWGGSGADRLQLVHRACRPGNAEHAELRQVPRERGLGRLDALRGEKLRQLLLGRDAARPQQAADLFLALVLAGFLADQSHARIQEPTPWSVNSSPMIECGTRPSSRCTLCTPAESTLRMLLALAFIPPLMVPSSIKAIRSAPVSCPISSPALRMPGTSER